MHTPHCRAEPSRALIGLYLLCGGLCPPHPCPPSSPIPYPAGLYPQENRLLADSHAAFPSNLEKH